MDLDQKLDILAPAARFDACDSYSRGGRRYTPRKASWNDGATVVEGGADGRALSTFRVLMSSTCEWNCPYCPLRSGNDTPRAAFDPEDLAKVFLPRYERGAVQGLFVSTGVDGGAHAAVGRMLDAVEYVRTRHTFDGYVHIKLLPGTAFSDVERAARLANRLSLNLEAPTAAHLAHVSPQRDWARDLIERLVWAREWHAAGFLPSGLATQFVVGAAGESDRELLVTTSWLYRDLGLARVYYGAFRPAPGTPFESHAPTPYVRPQRLGEADWLLRHYGFSADELPYDPHGDLPLHIDPKLAWALAHPELFPVEINSAGEETLLRVPGLGPTSVRRILRLRKHHRFSDPDHLKGLGTAANRARDFVTLDGRFFGRNETARAHHYSARGPIVEQLTLW